MLEVEVRRHSPTHPWTYPLLDLRQREILERIQSGGPGAILISEVAPVITLGRRTSPSDLLLDPQALNALGIQTYPVDRGGFATYHGPGQWIVFVVESLERLTGDRRGVRLAVCKLLNIALEVGQQFDPSAQIRAGIETGVWTERGKFAALGIHIERGVVLHGLAINVFKTPESFVGLRPCGLDAPVDYLVRDVLAPGNVEDAPLRETRFLECLKFIQHCLKSSVSDLT